MEEEVRVFHHIILHIQQVLQPWIGMLENHYSWKRFCGFIHL